jgi:SnoaL-like polyketide cyclase
MNRRMLMRFAGVVIGLTLFVITPTYTEDTRMTPLHTVQAYYNLYTAKPSREVLDTQLDDQFVTEDGPLGIRVEGKEAVWQFATKRDTARAGKESTSWINCHEYLGTAERGVVRWTWTFRGDVITPLFGLDPIERDIVVEGLALVTFRDGKLATLYEFYDGAEMLRQLGAKIPAPQSRKPD